MLTPEVGAVAEGIVVRVTPHYAILLFEGGWTGLLHISEFSNSYIRDFTACVSVGNIYNVKVISVEEEGQKVHLSLKQMTFADRQKSYRRQKVDPSQIDFSALEEKLPEWIESQNQGGKR